MHTHSLTHICTHSLLCSHAYTTHSDMHTPTQLSTAHSEACILTVYTHVTDLHVTCTDSRVHTPVRTDDAQMHSAHGHTPACSHTHAGGTLRLHPCLCPHTAPSGNPGLDLRQQSAALTSDLAPSPGCGHVMDFYSWRTSLWTVPPHCPVGSGGWRSPGTHEVHWLPSSLFGLRDELLSALPGAAGQEGGGRLLERLGAASWLPGLP